MHGIYMTFVIIYEIIVIIAVLHVVMSNRQPVKTMAWALVIYFVPVAGIVLYLFFGLDTRKERLIGERSLNQLTKRSMLGFVGQQNLRVPDGVKPLVDLFVNQSFSLPFKDNAVEIFTEGSSFFLDLLKSIGAAKSSIHIDMYIFADDALGYLVADALIDKARSGVEVRVIYDDVGCWNVSHSFFERMREEGIEVSPFLPVRFPSFTSKVNYRNHRKIIVIDGRVAYIGGMNIALRYVKGIDGQEWRDTMVRITGGVVYSVQKAFLVDWYFVDRTLISSTKYYPSMDDAVRNDGIAQIVTSGPVSEYPDIMQGYVRVILGARKYVYIESPYFLPTEPVLFALVTAALGGIDVRVLVPWRSDSRFVEWAGRSYMRDVMNAGVKIYRYNSGFLHSKFMLADDSVATVGSTNVDFRSFENNFEANVFFFDTDVVRRFKSVFMSDISVSELLNDKPPVVRGRFRSFFVRLWESLIRLLSPLL
ncbi:cardiolipin synthase [Xylanibacter muris]|uniref:Cardiolipin synthase n=1 Tax=Xylanibacter muris TaxID=2736290 RepID=A0ABX2AKN7_9BACT|nr:cardiolipin synthase [Xylanibacter muris]NPD91614.1 cardiolipin synthase [Xylanibacter muris]